MGRVNLSSLSEEETTVRFFRRELDIDVIKTYEKLKDIARIPVDKFKDRFALMHEINQSAYNAWLANRIYLKVHRQCALFEIEYNGEMRELTRLAIARLNAWFKATENVRKQITKDMIDQEIAAYEESRERYTKLVKRQEELHEIRDNLKSLAQQWSDRKGLLQTQAGLLKAQKEVILGKGGQSDEDG